MQDSGLPPDGDRYWIMSSLPFGGLRSQLILNFNGYILRACEASHLLQADGEKKAERMLVL